MKRGWAEWARLSVPHELARMLDAQQNFSITNGFQLGDTCLLWWRPVNLLRSWMTLKYIIMCACPYQNGALPTHDTRQLVILIGSASSAIAGSDAWLFLSGSMYACCVLSQNVNVRFEQLRMQTSFLKVVLEVVTLRQLRVSTAGAAILMYYIKYMNWETNTQFAHFLISFLCLSLNSGHEQYSENNWKSKKPMLMCEV